MTHDLFKAFIQQFPNYSDADFDLAMLSFKALRLQKGDHFIEQDRVCKKIAFIETGLLRTYYLNDGLEVTTCFCRERTLASSFKSVITQTPSELAIQAIEESTLWVIQYHDLEILYNKSPFWQQVGRLVAQQEFVTVECYTRFLNDQTAKQRYLHILEHESDLLLRVPLIYMASYLQIAPETLSRIRKEIIT
jgi:CRP-like cAMP-binding protein